MTEPPRPAFYFTVDIHPRNYAWARLRTLFSEWPPPDAKVFRSPHEVLLDGLDRPDEQGDSMRVSFILAPKRTSVPYDLLVCRDPGLVDGAVEMTDSLKREISAVASRRIKSKTWRSTRARWRAYSRVADGLFYSAKGEERELLRVIPGWVLCYATQRKRIMALGVPRDVQRVDVGLSGFGKHYSRLDRSLREAVQQARARAAVGRTRSKPKADATQLDWEILPEGHWVARQALAISKPHRSARSSASQMWRLSYLDSFGPTAWYSGTIFGRRIYYVAVFQGIAVAESSDYGNAMYYHVCNDDSWKLVFRRTKASALGSGADRLFHSRYWQGRLSDLLRIYGRGGR